MSARKTNQPARAKLEMSGSSNHTHPFEAGRASEVGDNAGHPFGEGEGSLRHWGLQAC